MNQQLYYIKSTRGANLLVFDNYVHRKRCVKNNIEYWTCIDSNCKGKINLLSGNIIGQTEHGHEPDASEIISYKQRNLVKEAAKERNLQSCQEVYNTVTNQIIRDAEFNRDIIASSLNTFSQLKNSIAAARSSNYPPQPKSRSEIIVPESLTKTNAGETFLQFSDGDSDKIIVFFTQSFLKFLCESDHVYSDGTFKSVPWMFHSLYSMHIMKNRLMIPIVYALLPDASTNTYLRLLRIIQDACASIGLTWNPEKFTTDFEIAFHRALAIIFPSCVIKSCLFHFSQAIWRNVAKHNLTNRYKDNNGDNAVQLAVKKVSALPFLNALDICNTFHSIKAESPQDDDMKTFYNYVESTYINENARFPISTWNHFNDPDPRTNNHVEGWHHALNRSVGRNHANIWFYIEKLLQQQNNYESKLLMVVHGASIGERKVKYVKIDRKINLLTQEYINHRLSAIDFINSVKYYTRLHN